VSLKLHNVSLCWPNRIDECTLSSATTWADGFPLANLQAPQFTVRARAVGTSATFLAVLPTVRDIQSAALAAHNLTSAAQWRMRIYEDVAETVLLYDSGTGPAWDVSPDDSAIYPPLSVMLLPQAYAARAVRIDVSDAENPDGYIEIGRALIASVWQAQLNISWGHRLGFDIRTTTETAFDKLTDYHDVAPPRRTAAFVYEHLTPAEALCQVAKMQRTLGVHGEVLVSIYSDPCIVGALETTFIATLAEPSAIEYPNLAWHRAPFALTEKRAECRPLPFPEE
jgi:hypothetical protein